MIPIKTQRPIFEYCDGNSRYIHFNFLIYNVRIEARYVSVPANIHDMVARAIVEIRNKTFGWEVGLLSYISDKYIYNR